MKGNELKIEFFTKPGVVKNVYDSSLSAIIATWTDLGPHDFARPCVEAQLEVIRKNPVKVMIVDAYNAVGVLKSLDQDWLGEEVFPKYEQAGLRAVITVPSKSALSRLSSNQYQQTGSDFKIDFVEVESLEEAIEMAGKYN